MIDAGAIECIPCRIMVPIMAEREKNTQKVPVSALSTSGKINQRTRMKEANTPMQRALWQVPLLVVLAGIIALAVNHWRDAPLPLIGDWSVQARFTDQSGQSLTIPLEKAKQLFKDKSAKFLDARPPSQYAEGHIGDALSLPWQDATNAFTEIADQLDDQDTIITYCDGESCELSHDLALFLKDMGFTDVWVLVNGWTLWRDAGLPTEKAGAAHEK